MRLSILCVPLNFTSQITPEIIPADGLMQSNLNVNSSPPAGSKMNATSNIVLDFVYVPGNYSPGSIPAPGLNEPVNSTLWINQITISFYLANESKPLKKSTVYWPDRSSTSYSAVFNVSSILPDSALQNTSTLSLNFTYVDTDPIQPAISDPGIPADPIVFKITNDTMETPPPSNDDPVTVMIESSASMTCISWMLVTSLLTTFL